MKHLIFIFILLASIGVSAQTAVKRPELPNIDAIADDDLWNVWDTSAAVGSRTKNATSIQLKDYVLSGGSITDINLTGTSGATLDIGGGGTLKNGTFSEYGTDEFQLLRWAANSNAQPITQAVGATELGAIKRGTLPIAAGGTGSTTKAGALSNLLPDSTGLGSDYYLAPGGVWQLLTIPTPSFTDSLFIQGTGMSSGFGTAIMANNEFSGSSIMFSGSNIDGTDYALIKAPSVFDITGVWIYNLPLLTFGADQSVTLLSDASSLDATKLTGTVAAGRMPAFSGDASSSAGATSLTLATVNSNVGTFGGATKSLTATVNGKGLVTAMSEQTVTPAVGSITGLGTGVASALASTPNATGGVLTYAKIGTSGSTLPLLDGINTFSGATTISAAGAANTSSLLLTGAFYTGGTSTTTKPIVLIEPSGTTSTGWSTNGTALGVNTISSFSGNLADFKVNGSSVATITSGGTVGALHLSSTNEVSASNFTLSAGGYYAINSDTYLSRDSANIFRLGVNHSTTPTAQMIKAHDVTTGTGASLTIAGGKGSAAGGAVTIATSATNSTAVDRFSVSASGNVSVLASTTNYFSVTSNTSPLRELRMYSNYASLGDQAYGFVPFSGGSVNSSGALYIGGGGVIGFNGLSLFYGKIYNNNMNTIVNILNTAELQMGDDVNGTPVNQLIKAADGITGTNINGANLTIASGDSTGSGTSAIIFSTPTATGSTGTTARTASERMRISGAGLTVGSGTSIAKIKHGTATLSSGTVTVSDSDVASNSRIFIERAPGGDSGTIGDSYSFTVSAGASFTITAKTANATASGDNSTVSWLMINP